jgi:hypothetical protein
MRECKVCKQPLSKRHQKKYCSVKCQAHERHSLIIEKIENGDTNQTHRQYRSYLISKFGASCMMCGWSKVNPITNLVPLEMDHIDGNSGNNNLENLRLICPNCSSLQPTYKALNKGKGRFSRIQRYKEGKSY